jgi:5-methylcytosine-specific restriction endonuclease McrA
MIERDSEPLPAPTKRDPIPAKVRFFVFERDGYRCVFCGAVEDLTIDHIYPRILGGAHTEDNLQTLCRSCNSRKGARVLCP